MTLNLLKQPQKNIMMTNESIIMPLALKHEKTGWK